MPESKAFSVHFLPPSHTVRVLKFQCLGPQDLPNQNLEEQTIRISVLKKGPEEFPSGLVFKDLALSLQWFGSLLWCRFYRWPGSLLWVHLNPKQNQNKNKGTTHSKDPRDLEQWSDSSSGASKLS